MHANGRLGEQDRICLLVLVGARPDGTKKLIAVKGGYRESTVSWSGVLRVLTWRRIRAPALAIVDGAQGFWAAVRDIRPGTREQRDWANRIMNVPGKTPSRPQSRARRALQEIRNESKLLTSYSLPAEH